MFQLLDPVLFNTMCQFLKIERRRAASINQVILWAKADAHYEGYLTEGDLADQTQIDLDSRFEHVNNGMPGWMRLYTTQQDQHG